jgi:protein arginine N-methyltransferase 1
MIKDSVRTNSYKTAIESNVEQFKGKIVLDVGCGTGILSIFAARAGAKHVYGIENAEIALYAQQIVKDNSLSDQITIIKGKVEEIELPVDKVDIIISEWMGYFLLYESMLDVVLFARDKWLDKENGIILPDKAIINIATIEDYEYKLSKLHFWDNVYGLKMSTIRHAAIREPLIDICYREAINSTVCRIFEIDLYTVTKEDLDFTAKYSLKFIKDDTVHALVAWFDIFFDRLENRVSFTTSPLNDRGSSEDNVQSTHWKQTVFYLENDLQVCKNDVLSGSIAVRKAINNFRCLDVKISYNIDGEKDKKNFVQMYKIQ